MQNLNLKSELSVQRLENRMMLSTVDVFAAGETGSETFELLVNDQVVQTFENVKGRPGLQEYVRYRFETTETLSGSDIRIRFTNDEYRPDDGFDRNLYVSKIVIDGVTYETESPSTFTTGVYRDGSFTGPGFFETEVLHDNGSFFFSDDNSSPPPPPFERIGTFIRIEAKGATGEELMQLLIDDEVVADFEVQTTNSFGSFFYRTDRVLENEQIKIGFANDLYDPDNGVDRNLIVDQVQVVDLSYGDRQRFVTTSPATFSTGTWTAEDGIVSGFGRGDTLHTNGIFQFAQEAERPDDGDPDLLDRNFGSNGFAAFTESASFSPQLARSSNGKLVTATDRSTGREQGFTDIHVFNADGSRDSQFGENGFVRRGGINLSSVSMAADGSVLYTLSSNRFQSGIVYKLNANGTPDSNFGTDGQLRFAGVSGATAAFTPDGDILFAASTAVGGDSTIDIKKYDSTGQQIQTFNGGGVLQLESQFGTRNEFRFLDNGGIIVFNQFSIAKLGSQGFLDSSFAGDGIISDPFGGPLVDIKIDSQDQIIASGWATSDLRSEVRFARIQSNGNVDSTFRMDSLPRIENPGIYTLGGFDLDDQDRVVGVLTSAPASEADNLDFTRSVFRLTDEGLLDNSFGSDGFVVDLDESISRFDTDTTYVQFISADNNQYVAATRAGLRKLNLGEI